MRVSGAAVRSAARRVERGAASDVRRRFASVRRLAESARIA
jgi:hypothetical protein